MTAESKGPAGYPRFSQLSKACTTFTWVLIVVISLFSVSGAKAATYYVNAVNSAPVAPYTSWLTAATNIQDAIAMTVNGDTVLVTNGVYGYGGAVMSGTLTNRVALTNAITVESVNGPWVTTILGSTNPAVRCAWLTNGAALIGFTLTGGDTQSGGAPGTYGGGVWCASSNAYVGDCVIVSNTAVQFAAVYQGTLKSCLIRGNGSASPAIAAVIGAVLNNCTVVSNAFGVGSALGMTNCIIYYNTVENYGGSGITGSHCCTTPALAGTGNFTTAPSLFPDGVHLANGSPCIGAGVYIGGGSDILGDTYSNPPSVGCAEWTPTPSASAPQIALIGNPIGFSVGKFGLSGATPFSFSWLQNGQPLIDNGHFSGTQSSNLVATGVSFADAGNYQVVVSNAFGVVTSAVATLTIHCVNVSGINPVAPYTSWATAATDIQDAITASAAGDVVLVTNGLYNSGEESMDGVSTNRVSINKAILLQSINGPTSTIIQGAWDPTSTNGPGAVRCVWMTNNAILNGFTISGGATRESSAGGFFSTQGGGILVLSTNSVIYNCVLSTNIASSSGGGIFGLVGYPATVIGCELLGNQAVGAGGSGAGGGAYLCNLQNCIVENNQAPYGSGGGADYCNLKNCALIGNVSYYSGAAANEGTLMNCTVVSNISYGDYSYGAVVYSAVLTNCIVMNNFPSANYASSTLAYCCADPLPSGPGNIDVNPQLLADGFHLAQTSPCIGAGTTNGVSGTDIDGQSWNNPPSIGCDEWYPQPLIILQPSFQAGFPPRGLTLNVAAAGQTPFEYFWTQNGVLIQDDGHHANSSTANMTINDFGPGDAGIYQVVVSNSFGSVTSAPVQVVIHAVDAAGVNPVPPYSSWANAATNIQDAINVASAGDIVLVTNGIYSSGGMAVVGSLTNRVAITIPVTVISVNGFKNTIIQGAWDPISTNGPGAVRCAWVGAGAILNGFTLENGATYGPNNGFQYGSLESGGGVWCNYSSNALVLNCELTNNSALYGGGAAYGTVDNSLIVGNVANFGGGALNCTLNNCTVINNDATSYAGGAGTYSGGGVYYTAVRNSIVIDNYDAFSTDPFTIDNYSDSFGGETPNYAYTLSAGNVPLPPSEGNINAEYLPYTNAIFVDLYHVSIFSPTYDAGSSAYATGYDLDGQPWNNPPSMGCSEIVVSNLVGPLTVNCSALFTNAIVGHTDGLFGNVQGHVAFVSWCFGDGPTYSNIDNDYPHEWATNGIYTVTFTAYNNDNPNGVSTNLTVFVQNPLPVQVQSAALSTNGFGFQFAGQMNADYIIQYTTNLSPPVSWQTLQTIFENTQTNIQVLDPSVTNAARFYRVLTQ